MTTRCNLASLLALGLLSLAAPATDTWACEDRLGEPISEVEIRGELGLVASGSLLRVIDVSQPIAIGVVGRLRMPGRIAGMAFAGDALAVVAAGDGGCLLVDLSDPQSPSSRDVGLEGPVSLVAAEGDRIAAVEQLAGGPGPRFRFDLIDVSDPDSPTPLGSVTADGTVEDMELADDLAYLARSDRTLVEIDISSPFHLFLRTYTGAFTGQSGSPVRIAMRDDTVYVTELSNPLEYYSRVYALGLPIWDRPWSFTEMSRLMVDVEDAGDLLVFADVIRGMTVLDISDPQLPWLNTYSPPRSRIVDVELADGFAFVADESRGLQTVDMSDPGTPREIATLELDSWHPLLAMAEGEDLLVGASAQDGLTVIDTSDPARPRLLASASSIGRGNSVAVSGQVAFVACGERGVEVIDLSAPETPMPIGTIATVGDALHVVTGSHLVVVSDETAVLDITDPAEPRQVSAVTVTGHPLMRGDLLLLAAPDGLRVVDLEDPSAPSLIGFLETDWQAPGSEISSLAAADDRVYVASLTTAPWTGRLHLIDLHDPHSPSELGSVALGWPVFGLTPRDGELLAAVWNRGILSFDVVDPIRPRLVNTFFPDEAAPMGWPQEPMELHGLLGSGPVAYTGLTRLDDVTSLLRIVNISDPAQPRFAGSLPIRVAHPLCGPDVGRSISAD